MLKKFPFSGYHYPGFPANKYPNSHTKEKAAGNSIYTENLE